MKSLHKAAPKTSPVSWEPPELNEPAESSLITHREQVQAIFQNEDENNATQKGTSERSALHVKETGKVFKSWQPQGLGQQAEATEAEEWSFIEIADTPFDKSWKIQKPATVSGKMDRRENFISEDQAAVMLDRARHQAEEIILAAQSEADEILAQVESEIEEQKKQAFQQGRAEGRAEIDGAMQAARKMVSEMEAWQAEFLAEGEKILVEMIKDISRKMFGEGVKLDPQALHTNLNRVMENARGLGVLKIFLNPNDARHLDPSWGEQQMLILGEQVKVIPSGNILPGGCLIKGNIGTVDARVETQLDAILKTFDEPGTPAE